LNDQALLMISNLVCGQCCFVSNDQLHVPARHVQLQHDTALLTERLRKKLTLQCAGDERAAASRTHDAGNMRKKAKDAHLQQTQTLALGGSAESAAASDTNAQRANLTVHERMHGLMLEQYRVRDQVAVQNRVWEEQFVRQVAIARARVSARIQDLASTLDPPV